MILAIHFEETTAWEKMSRRKSVPPAAYARTDSGGHILYFQADREVADCEPLPGLTVRGGVAPPTQKVAEAPVWLYAWVAPTPR